MFTPELDVSAVPEGIEMCVPLVGERKNKILRVAVIRRADDNVTAGPEQLLRETRQATRSSEMLNYLGSNSHIEALIANRSWIVVHSELMKYQPGRRTLCEPNAVRARLATHHFVSAPGQHRGQVPGRASDIEDSSPTALGRQRVHKKRVAAVGAGLIGVAGTSHRASSHPRDYAGFGGKFAMWAGYHAAR